MEDHGKRKTYDDDKEEDEILVLIFTWWVGWFGV